MRQRESDTVYTQRGVSAVDGCCPAPRLLNQGDFALANTGSPYRLSPTLASGFAIPAMCGQYDLAPYQGTPPSVEGAAAAKDWRVKCRPVPSGRLLLRVTARFDDGSRAPSSFVTMAELLRRCKLGVLVSTWQTWDSDFGEQAWTDSTVTVSDKPSQATRRWGPELISRMAETGSVEIDISRWAAGARFVAVYLVAWHKTVTFNGAAGNPAKVSFDWQIVEDIPRDEERWPWPVSQLTSRAMRDDDFPVTLGGAGAGTQEGLWCVGASGTMFGRAPRVAAVDNPNGGAIKVCARVFYGAGEVFIPPFVVPAGSTSIVVNETGASEPTGIIVYATSDPIVPVTPYSCTVSFSGG